LGVYTHVELHDQTAAIGSLPAPPGDDHASMRFTIIRSFFSISWGDLERGMLRRGNHASARP
jgi:hypothetical protein